MKLIPIILLAFAAQVHAIGIVLDVARIFSVVGDVHNSTELSSMTFPFTLRTATNGNSSTWTGFNGQEQAHFRESFSLSSSGNIASISSFWQFTLTQAVDYSLTGILFNHDGKQATLGLTIGTNPFGFVQNSGVTTNRNGVFSPAALSGTLDPGSYFFATGPVLIGSGGIFGETVLALTGHVPVPDAGSTALMLGFGLGVLLIANRRIQRAL